MPTNQDKYIMLYGYDDLIPEKWFDSSKYKSVEEVYGACLEQEKTWRELTGWNKDKDPKIIL